MSESDLLQLALIVALAVAGQAIAARTGIPSIILLLGLGFAAGAGLGVLDPDELLGDLLVPIVSLSVAVILFDGGLGLRVDAVPEGAQRAVLGLLTVGVAVTWALTSLAAVLVFDLGNDLNVLLGAILIVSGPTVVLPLLRFIRPRRRVGEVVRWEGILIDPIGAVLAVFVFHAIASGEGFASLEGVAEFMISVSVGIAFGAAAAGILVWILHRHRLSRHLEVLVTLALVLLAAAVPDALREDTGLISVVLMGIILANQRAVSIDHIADFKSIIGGLLTAVLFIILAARVEPSSLTDLGLAGLAFVGAMVLVVRPVAVALSTVGSRLALRERAFLAWMAPKGIVAASVASVFALQLSASGVPGADKLVPITFLAIVLTVVIYGVTGRPVARLLGVDASPAELAERSQAPDVDEI